MRTKPETPRCTIRQHGYTREGKATSVLIKLVDGKLTNPRSIAKWAAIGWGRWQTSRKINCTIGNCWHVTTASHGGYIVVTQEPLLWWSAELTVETAFGNVYAYEFEEDCNWAVLEHHDDAVFDDHCNQIQQTRIGIAADMAETPREFLNRCIDQTLNAYHTEMVNAE